MDASSRALYSASDCWARQPRQVGHADVFGWAFLNQAHTLPRRILVPGVLSGSSPRSLNSSRVSAVEIQGGQT